MELVEIVPVIFVIFLMLETVMKLTVTAPMLLLLFKGTTNADNSHCNWNKTEIDWLEVPKKR